jgi:ribosome-binding protein aMBF1 (putative translation factor)
LITARKPADLNQAELALKLKRHQMFVARFESEQRRIDVNELIVVSREIGNSVERFPRIVEQNID